MTFDDPDMRDNGPGERDFEMLPAPCARHPGLGEGSADERPCQSIVRTNEQRARNDDAEAGDFKTGILVYQALVKHQRDASWWANCDRFRMLRAWGLHLIREFDLRVKDTVEMGMPLIRIEAMNVKTIATYRPEADGYAIIGSIVFNEERLKDLPTFMVLVLLLKCLLSAWQHQKGGNGTFDRHCRERMKAMGLIVTEKGAITIDSDGRFRRLLQELGIEVPATSVFPRPARKGKTTNRLWSCTCQKCRVGTIEFFATCPQCGEPFRLGDHVGKRFVRPAAATVPALR